MQEKGKNMLKNIKRGYVEEKFHFELTFDNGEHTNGYVFPCDGAGNVEEMENEGHASLKYCLAHPEKFARYNEVIRRIEYIHHPTSGECICGKKVELYDQYKGAFCCTCGRWYGACDGRELVDPQYWHDEN